MQVATTMSAPRKGEDRGYAALVAHTRDAVASGPLFTTDAAGLYDAFLEALPPDRRSHYACRACRKFVERYGGLVAIDANGVATSTLWSGWQVPTFFAPSVRAMANIVGKARVTGVFLSRDPVWGLPTNDSPKAKMGEWHHLHVVPKAAHCPVSLKTSDQVMAEKAEEYGMLCRGLAEFPIALVKQAHTLLTTGALYRSEKCIGVAKWLLDLHEGYGAKNRRVREHLTWRAVAEAPPGFCHVRSTMISTLLEDLSAGKAFAEIKRAFDAKMSPVQYQRPSAAPTDGQLAAAEAVVSKLAAAGSLKRRFARLDEILPHALWVPKPTKPADAPDGGVFGHLKSTVRAPDPIDIQPIVMTWDKFNWTVLPSAERVELDVPRGPAAFFAFVTAEDMKAPPILQWDSEAKRNPVSWYLYNGGSLASAWNLTDAFVDVLAITSQPSGWTSELAHQGDGAYAILRGARDMNAGRAGLGLFPETLKSEFHGIRAAIEAYSRSKELGGVNEVSACGIALQKSSPSTWGQVFRVTSNGSRICYRIDRWD